MQQFDPGIPNTPVQNPTPVQYTASPSPQVIPLQRLPSQDQPVAQYPAGTNVKKILICEDEIPLLKALSHRLIQEGFVVIEAKDGKQGLEFAMSQKPDLIISDIVMPDMDGLNMVKNIRESIWGSEIPIILLTNLNNSSDVATALQYNVPDYLVKSDMKLKDIVDKVKEKLMV